MQGAESQRTGLVEALAVAKGSMTPDLTEEDAKLFLFFLRDGECTAVITESTIAVRYSWLFRSRPSNYYVRLAPAIICRLMQLGGVTQVVDEAIFSVGPTTTGTGHYVFDVATKWVRIRCEDERIVILVRDERKSLDGEMGSDLWNTVRCERCNQELRTPMAKQCLHCGYDWH